MKEVLKIFFLITFTKTGFTQQAALSQGQRENNIEIDFGFVHTRLIDEGFTYQKFIFRGTNPKAGLTYAHQNATSIFNFMASISAGNISTKQNELSIDFLYIFSALEYLRKIKTFKSENKESRLFGGLQLHSKNYVLQNDAIFDNIDIFSLHGIYFKLLYQLNLIKKQSLQFSFAIPAIVYANRVLWNSGASEYAESDIKRAIKLLTTHGRYYCLNFLNDVQLNVSYKKPIGKNVDVVTSYTFTYLSNAIERPIHLYSNELALGLKFNFK